MMAEWYIRLVSDFITDCKNEINKPKGNALCAAIGSVSAHT